MLGRRGGGKSSEGLNPSTAVMSGGDTDNNFLPWNSQAGMDASGAAKTTKELKPELEQMKNDKELLEVN